ncbi:MAG: hypothetical protein AVDCRST_MAG61-2970 [uncultured Friedmanniella sp.]|uniref:Uncharacterized protein n=1 Tax=uncultured Friedmanniella sp. TaxID=335381 RepID=A0A6J4LID3_9ACTN|nr:hypothetical protein [uncultured Friedmanniella sp.]CAA9332465.1 MAG: hypothetical protein AVDCRST_MAG61-2970 [uncultured Friedmanniella sp.]
MRARKPLIVAGALVAVVLMCSCGRAPDPGPEPPVAATDRRLVARATVLDDGSGPKLCLGGVMESYPPQCSGPAIDGWTWPDHGTERHGGITWGSFFVVGTYDRARFTAERVIDEEKAAASFPREPEPDFTSPCSEPPGGWRAVDPERSTARDQERVFAAAQRLRGYAGAWLDDRGGRRQDPRTSVVNVQVTVDVDAAEAELREVWGGPLCVSRAEHTEKELARIAAEVMSRPGALHASHGRGAVDLGMDYDDGTLQRELDRRYGTGLVRVHSALQPYRG